MIRKIILVATLLGMVVTNAQEVMKSKKVQTKFLRPSVIEVYGTSLSDSNSQKLLSMMNDIPLQKRFNYLGLKAEFFKNTPPPPEKSYFDAVKGVFSKKRKPKPADLVRDKAFQPIMDDLAKDAIAKWFLRDSNGDFSTDYIVKRGLETADDKDYIESKAAKIDRRSNLGNEMVKFTYVFLYDINKLEKKERTAQNDLEQWTAKYTARVYKLVWDEETQNYFDNKLWSDKTSHNQENVNRWKDAKFSFAFVDEVRGSAHASTIDHKSDDELLAIVADEVKKESILKITKKVDDLKTKSSIHSEKPITAKIGTKEGLAIDQRYFVYEIVKKDENSPEEKKRRGVLRVKKVANTDGEAKGHTATSVFTQQGGRKLYQGMLIELNEDRGIIPNIGYTMNFGNKALGGISGGASYRISDIFKQLRKINSLKNNKTLKKLEQKVVPGIHAGFNVTLNMFKDLQYGRNQFSGMTWLIEGRLSKEFYFTPKGNIYVQPYVGVGFSSYSFSKINGQKITQNTNKPSMSAFALPFGLKLGYNIHPSVSIAVIPHGIKTFQYTFYKGKNDKTGIKMVNIEGDEQGFGLDRLEGALNFGATVSLRIRI